ncbi:antibiotic biosynthesis monooxygenase family protein [Actinomadura rayongensis]|uniref:Antibiotic biosynthesis monooxygenase n=1 Tax=Actinomadura rayongensis TaxID=1429076 RepID=A0A6I4WIR2_9ACTN|nr:antibiotic biosynthesis monooxygenase family protein [Actinomadura rayongensis]MXQ68235.1 antibiotic biosynthesis monooxygenase [Actinomadura rayongensis]
MPTFAADGKYLTVLNLFTTDTDEKQGKLIGAMRDVVDNAAYPGWISSTVHSGKASPGTANFIQWRSGEDLEARYAGEEFKHRTLPLFREITTSIKLLQTDVVYTQRAPEQTEIEIGPDRDDFTVIQVIGAVEGGLDDLVEALGAGHAWLSDVPGYRSHTVLRGRAARGLDGPFAVVYSQWDDEASFTAFRDVSKDEQSSERRAATERVEALSTFHDWNTYQVVHTRSAAAPTGSAV